MRRSISLFLTAGLLMAAAATLAPQARHAEAATVPAGFSDTAVASVNDGTAVEVLPDGRLVVLEQGGRMRIGPVTGALTTALTLDVCTTSERGLLGFTHDPAWFSNRFVYVYYTRPAPGLPGGCVNRVSRFTLGETTVVPGSEVVLIDNISSVNGNHNGGDLDIGSDGFLYIAVGDAGAHPRDPSQRAGDNRAAQDLSLLNGKILRITLDGQPAPGNPISGGDSARCATRGNTPSTPNTWCQELFAWGLRNPYRFAFDRSDGSNRFFINDVGQSTLEEVNLGAIGANYGWPDREGSCARGAVPPCAAPPAGSGLAQPITDYPRSDGTYITGGVFVPEGVWPAAFDDAYLFADGGSGKIWIRYADGSLSYAAPFATGANGIVDMTFAFDASGRAALYYVQNGGGLRVITPTTPPATSARSNLRMIPVTPVRAYDTGNATTAPIGVAAGDVFNGTTRLIDLSPPAGYEAALINLTYSENKGVGHIRTWGTEALRPATSSLNADTARSVAANAAVVPLDADGTFLLESAITTRVVIDVLAWLDEVPAATTAGRFVSLAPARLADTRIAAGDPLESGSGNPFTRSADEIQIVAGDKLGVPADAAAVAISVAAIGQPDRAGFVGAHPTGQTWGGTSNVNVLPGDTRANMLVVPLGSDGKISLHTLDIADVAVDVLGYVTGGSAPSASTGLYSSIDSVRAVDTRDDVGFASLDPGTVRSITVDYPSTISGVVQNLTVTATTASGWVATFPQSGTVPLVSTSNYAANQTRANLAFTAVSPSRGVSYTTLVPTDLVVDIVGVFS